MSRPAHQQTSRPGKSDSGAVVVPLSQGQIRSVRDLQVFQRSYDSALNLHKLTLEFPKIEQYGGLADQIRRGSKSVCGNLAEGFAKKYLSIPEFKRFLGIAYGSAEEVQVWLAFARDLGYLPPTQSEDLIMEYREIAKMLLALIKKWEQKQ